MFLLSYDFTSTKQSIKINIVTKNNNLELTNAETYELAQFTSYHVHCLRRCVV